MHIKIILIEATHGLVAYFHQMALVDFHLWDCFGYPSTLWCPSLASFIWCLLPKLWSVPNPPFLLPSGSQRHSMHSSVIVLIATVGVARNAISGECVECNQGGRKQNMSRDVQVCMRVLCIVDCRTQRSKMFWWRWFIKMMMRGGAASDPIQYNAKVSLTAFQEYLIQNCY